MTNFGGVIYDYVYRKGINEGDFEEALKFYNRALSIRTRIDDKLGLAKSYFNLGLYNENKKETTPLNRQKAFEFYQKGLEIAIAGNHKLEQSYFYRHLASFHQEDLDKVIDYHKKSVELREEIGFKYSLQFPYFSIAYTYVLKNEFENAKIYFLRSLSAAINVNRNKALTVLIFRRGDNLMEEKGSKTTSKYFKTLLEIAQIKENFELADKLETHIKNL